MSLTIPRRDLVLGLAGAAAAGWATSRLAAAPAAPAEPLQGNINHSVSRWCYGKLSLDDLCRACQRIGIKSVELVRETDWPTLQKYGLTCAMTSAGLGIEKGFNRREYHDQLVADLERLVPLAAAAKMPSIICMSGNRQGMADDEGMKNCEAGVKRVVGLCEKHQVNLVMELLNSKVDHADYMCDHTVWGVELCKRVGSERFKLLYDIYHMQIMEGDLIRTIREHAEYIAHYHTGGNPGRNEIDERQEINYPAVMRAIVATGYQGFVGQEFVPADPDPLVSLERCIRICDV
ncbi:MAG: TIM barrel protein [Pirellulaceae bacterium]|jgi:hydroxypyruvate isomerase|nr:TIM barrel protein [Pirellulaceae bacterium]